MAKFSSGLRPLAPKRQRANSISMLATSKKITRTGMLKIGSTEFELSSTDFDELNSNLIKLRRTYFELIELGPPRNTCCA